MWSNESMTLVLRQPSCKPRGNKPKDEKPTCQGQQSRENKTWVNSCEVVIYNRKQIFGLPPIPGTAILKPLEFPVMRVTKVFFVTSMTWLLDHLGMGTGCQGNQPEIEFGTFNPTPWFLRSGEGLEVESIINGQWLNQSYLCNKASTKS